MTLSEAQVEGGRPLWQDRVWLVEKYWGKGLSLAQVAEAAGCHFGTVWYWIQKYDIPRRSLSEANRIRRDSSTPGGREARRKASEANKARYDPSTPEGREAQRKTSEANKARYDPSTPEGREARRKTSEANKARYDPSTPEGREARREQSEAQKGRYDPSTPEGRETRRRMSEAVKARYDPSTSEGREARREQSEAQKGRYDPSTPEGREARRKTSEFHKARFDPSTPEGREARHKTSVAFKAAWSRGDIGDEEHSRKKSVAIKAAWARGDYDGEEYRRKRSEASKTSWERGDFDGVFRSPTGPEIAVAAALDSLQVEYVTEFRPDGYSRPFDFFVPPSTLLEVQGTYWHNRPGAPKRDAEKAAWAREHRYNLVALWEHDINEVGAFALIEGLVLPLLKTAIHQKKSQGGEDEPRRQETIPENVAKPGTGKDGDDHLVSIPGPAPV